MYLQDLLVAMTRIAEYLEGYNFDQFKKDYKTVDAVIRNFEIIGEASKKLPGHIKENNLSFFSFCLRPVINSRGFFKYWYVYNIRILSKT